MSHRAESSSSSRPARRLSSAVARFVAYPVGTETGLPLIVCPDCKLARVIELRVVQDTRNKGRSFFKCPRNGVSFGDFPFSFILALACLIYFFFFAQSAAL